MRILLANTFYATPNHPRIVGGAEVFTSQLAATLADSGETVEVVRLSPDRRYHCEEVNGLRVHFIPGRNIYVPFEEKHNALAKFAWHLIDDRAGVHPRVSEIIRQFKPDVVHTNTLAGLTTSVWQAARNQGRPIVHTLHDYYLTCPRSNRFRNGRTCEQTCSSCSLLSAHRRANAELVDAVVGVSRRTLDIHLAEGLFADTAIRRVIHNVADPAITLAPEPATGDRIVLGYLGRISVAKGLDLLLQTMNLVQPGKFVLKIAGNASENERRRLKALAPSADVEFVGFVRPTEFYRQVDLVAFPPVWEEPSGLALLDALAAGRPVIGTKCGAVGETLRDGVNGWLVEPDAKAFAAQLDHISVKPEMLHKVHDFLAGNPPARDRTSLAEEYREVYAEAAALQARGSP